MKLNLDQPILDFDGKEMPQRKDSKDPMTLKYVFFTALSEPSLETNVRGEQIPENLNVDQKMKMYKLCSEVVKGGEIDFVVDDLTLMKERVGKIFISPLIYGRVCEILDK